ncbi:hypothetical protein GJ496_010152 [Pomphorhynchus laevis]|nr:hypothetical protein GJ496_010152 [Pomphorhynchus laevis]
MQRCKDAKCEDGEKFLGSLIGNDGFTEAKVKEKLSVLSTTGAIVPTADQLLKPMEQRMATTSYKGYTDCIYHSRQAISTQLAKPVSMAYDYGLS